MGHFIFKSDPLPPKDKYDIILQFLVIPKTLFYQSQQWQDLNERFEALVFNKYQTKTQNHQNRHLATTLINMFIINLFLNKISCTAFGT